MSNTARPTAPETEESSWNPSQLLATIGVV